MQSEARTASSTGRVARSTLIVMGGLLLSMIVGLIRQRAVATTFGTGAAFDAYSAANGIPELLFTMLSGGALAFAFIPIYTTFLEKEDDHQGSALFSHVVNTILLLTMAASILLALGASVLVRSPWGIAPHFNPETQVLTASIMRILLLSTIIFSISSILSGTLQAHQHFLLPALAPSMYSLGILGGALLLAPVMGIFGLAWGAVAGALLHLLVQVPGLLRFHVRWRPSLGWANPDLRRVATLMAPRVLDLLMARASIDWINANLGSGLGEGRVSALRYAFQLMNTPWTLIGTAIGIAVFPTMAALAARHEPDAQREALHGALRAILSLAIPAGAALLLLGRPIIGILFEGGEFTAESTELVYYALQFYVVALISQSMLEVVVRAFAAQQDTLTPLLVSLFTTGVNIALAIWLSRPRSAGGFEHGGLALANGLAVLLEATIDLIILHRRGAANLRRVVLDFGRALVASGGMAIIVWVVLNQLQPGRFASLGIGAAVGGASYLFLALLLGLNEIKELPLAIIKGIRKS